MTNKIKKLSDHSHLRKRVPLYLGSDQPHIQDIVLYNPDHTPYVTEVTWVPALYTCLREIIDNALDEINGHGFGNRIDVTFDSKTLTMTVADNGRGIPIDYDEDHKQYLATMVLSEPRAGRNFDDRGEVAGVNGIGSAAVSNTSEWFRFEVIRDGKKFKQEFSEGPESSTELTIGKAKITPSQGKTGTKIEFKLSERVYLARTLPDEFVRSRITEIAIANPHIKISFNGNLIKVKPKVEQSLFPDKKPIIVDIDEETIKSRFYILPSGDGPEHIHTIVNNIPAFNGGVHVDTFRRHFYGNLITALEKESKKRKLSPNRSDVQDGLFIYNITNMKAPNFDSQSKSRLINEEIAIIVKKSLENDSLYRDLIKRNPDWINGIYERCAKRTMKKDAAELSKLNKANKRVKVEKLMDATGRDRTECILLLAEGDSAISGLTEARDPKIHGGLPLRGKVLNCHPSKSSLKDVANNEALQQIMRSVGLSVGEPAVRNKLRYGKIFITTDADQDGLNIAALLVNFFYQLWPELFDPKDPYIYVFDTPLIIARKGKDIKYWYSDEYNTFDQDKYKGWEVSRAKGLANLRKNDWNYVLRNPKVQPIVDDGKLMGALDLIFNEGLSDKRKEWMGLL